MCPRRRLRTIRDARSCVPIRDSDYRRRIGEDWSETPAPVGRFAIPTVATSRSAAPPEVHATRRVPGAATRARNLVPITHCAIQLAKSHGIRRSATRMQRISLTRFETCGRMGPAADIPQVQRRRWRLHVRPIHGQHRPRAFARRAARDVAASDRRDARWHGFELPGLGRGHDLRRPGQGLHGLGLDGNEFIDLRMGYGPVILGHADDRVDDYVNERMRRGVSFSLTSEDEIRANELVQELTGWVEMSRLTVSGTEATMHAMRVARAFTGRNTVSYTHLRAH